MTVCLWLKNYVIYWTRRWCRIRTLKPKERWWRVSGDWCTLSKWDGASSFLLSLLKILTMYPRGSPQSQYIMNLNLNKNLSQNKSRLFCKWMNWNTCFSWNIINGLFFIADFDIKIWFLNFVIYMEVFYAWFDLRFTCIKHVTVHVTSCSYIFLLAHTSTANEVFSRLFQWMCSTSDTSYLLHQAGNLQFFSCRCVFIGDNL